ncbi:hypothetical protein K3495_g8074 [Podosphaera aphanis]|nr:hypothetical protein K3495_g8074 [Podosphaera aphanis]
MDLRAIINTEAGDISPITKQAVPGTPEQSRTTQSSRSYSHSARSPSDKYSPEAFRIHQSDTPTISNYSQNFHGRRPPPPPIQPSPQQNFRSPAQSLSIQSPHPTTPSSATSHHSFPLNYPASLPHNRHLPPSPAQSHQFIAAPQYKENFQKINPPHPQHQKNFSRGSPPPLNSPPAIPEVQFSFLAQQQSQSFPISSTTQDSNESINSLQLFKESKLAAEKSRTFQTQQSHLQSQNPHALPSCYQSQTILPENFQHLEPSGYQISGESPTLSRSTPNVHLPRQPSGQNSNTITLTERYRTPQGTRKRSISVSPKTRLPNLQREEVNPQIENECIETLRCKMKDGEARSFEGRGLEQQDAILITKENDLNMPVDVHAQISAKQPSRKRVRYTETPVWARSIRETGITNMKNKDPAKNNHKQIANQAPFASLPGRAQINENSANLTNPRAIVTESHPSLILGSWQESISGKKPTEHMTKVVADFFYLNVVSRSDLGELSSRGVQIEIEAKLGEIIDKDTNQRFYLPVRSECILAEVTRVGFRSSMTEQHHKKLNGFLNELVKKSQAPGPSGRPKVKIDYLHRREIDVFYELPKHLRATLPSVVIERIPSHHNPKVRVTYDQKSGNILAKIIKARICDLDIHSGITGAFDCRISINFEMPFDGKLDELVEFGERSNQSPNRNKDRLSYKQSYYQIDLTQISANLGNRTDKEHEVEIEISTDAVMNQGRLAANNQPNEYLSLVEGLLNNIRVLSRYISEI